MCQEFEAYGFADAGTAIVDAISTALQSLARAGIVTCNESIVRHGRIYEGTVTTGPGFMLLFSLILFAR
jgi:hypothetical protein